MTDLSSELGPRKARPIRNAVYQNRALSKAGFSERLFALALLRPRLSADLGRPRRRHGGDGARARAIASSPSRRAAATCSPISPARRRAIDAVDLNAAHIALNRLKLAAFRHLPAQADLFRFFGEAGNRTIRRGLRPLHRAQSRRRHPPLLGEAQLARQAAHRGLRPQFLPHRPARPVHRGGPSRRAPLRRRSGRAS